MAAHAHGITDRKPIMSDAAYSGYYRHLARIELMPSSSIISTLLLLEYQHSIGPGEEDSRFPVSDNVRRSG